MDRQTAQNLRKQIVEFGTKKNLSAMTAEQRREYDRARDTSRNVMRHIGNVREDELIPALGAGNVADNYPIDDGDARAMAAAHHIVQMIAAELPS